MARKISIGLVQMAMTANVEQNIAKALELTKEAAARGAQIICLPELFTSPYFCTVEKAPQDYTVKVPGEIGAQLSKAAKDLKIVLIGGSVHEQGADKRYNTTLVYDRDGSLAGTYRKTHIPHDEGFYEHNYFAPGDTGYTIFKTSLCNFGVLICFDQWFPEAARAMALEGAEIIFYPTAIANVDGIVQKEGPWQSAWETVQRGHAVANNVVVAAVNRVGREDRSVFWGGSFVSDAFGTVVAKGGAEEEVITTVVDLDHNAYVRESWGFFRNRRPDTYGAITRKV